MGKSLDPLFILLPFIAICMHVNRSARIVIVNGELETFASELAYGKRRGKNEKFFQRVRKQRAVGTSNPRNIYFADVRTNGSEVRIMTRLINEIVRG